MKCKHKGKMQTFSKNRMIIKGSRGLNYNAPESQNGFWLSAQYWLGNLSIKILSGDYSVRAGGKEKMWAHKITALLFQDNLNLIYFFQNFWFQKCFFMLTIILNDMVSFSNDPKALKLYYSNYLCSLFKVHNMFNKNFIIFFSFQQKV